jgi:hypothetical protein
VRNVLVGLLWLWLLGALGIYAYRLYRRFTRGPKDEAESSGPSQSSPSISGPSKSGLSDIPVIGPASGVGTRPPSTTDTVPAPPPVPPASRVAPSSEPIDDSPSRSGLFAPTDTPGPPSTPGAATTNTDARPTVAEVLRGIAMPCDLSPIVDPDRVFDPYRVAFSTNTALASAVGAGVGDELERLDFALKSTSAHQLSATKAAQRVLVTIHTDPDAITYGDGQAFRNIPPGSVVVEFQT